MVFRFTYVALFYIAISDHIEKYRRYYDCLIAYKSMVIETFGLHQK